MKFPASIQWEASPKQQRLFAGLALLGGVLLTLGWPLSPQRAVGNVLIGALYLLGMGLGAAMFLAMDNLIEGGWPAIFRRIPEAMSRLIEPAILGIVLVVLAAPMIYPWVHEPPSGPMTTALKTTWLSLPFFALRAVIYFVIWISLSRALVRETRAQDLDGLVLHTQRNLNRSALLLVLYAVTIWLSGVDWVMSLKPEWFSTMTGVYQFAGLFLSGLAAMTLFVVWMGTAGPLRGVLKADHYHDLGKLLLAFACFWFYIWYSQYLIIWYANMPEETSWYLPQMEGSWGSLFLLNLALNWAIPFFALLPGQAKRNPKVLAWVASTILLGRFVDLYLMIGRPVYQGGAVISFMELGTLLAIVGIAGLVVLRALSHAPLVPLHDPYMGESLHHHA